MKASFQTWYRDRYLARVRKHARILKFDPRESRDDHGRWTKTAKLKNVAPTLRYFNMKIGGFTKAAIKQWLKNPANRRGVDLANAAWERKYGKKKRKKFDPGQPRNDAGRWIEEGLEGEGEVKVHEGPEKVLGKALDMLMKVFGADWMSALVKLNKEGAIPDLLSGKLDLGKLKKTPAFAGIMKFDKRPYSMIR